MRSFIPFAKAFGAALILFGCFAPRSFAATLNITPATGTHNVGTTFTVSAMVSTQGKAINAASGVISFPNKLLQVVSVSKTSSILSLWVEDPSYSNVDGTVSFEGVVPNPGYTGNSGPVVSITFKVLKEGSATVKYDSGSVLANDGAGTDVLTTMNTALFTLAAAPVKPPPTPAPAAPVTPAPTSTPPVVTPVVETATLAAPVIVSVIPYVTDAAPLVVKGTAVPGVTVVLTFSGAASGQATVKADAGGSWSYSPDQVLTNGAYSVTAHAKDSRGIESPESAAKKFTVRIPTHLGSLLIYILSVVILILIIIIVFLGVRLSRRKDKIGSDVVKVGFVLEKSFSRIKEDLDSSMRLLKDAKALRKLTAEEEHFMDRTTKNIKSAEIDVNRELEYLHKELS